ncbi:MAG TPA: SOS response-associated peptidase [Pirellulaceae bacterium]|jgi:putative SOS response-associated peptidase YedK|nr:SOS response-associated peptidase [Pirellulaceae bacterium]
MCGRFTLRSNLNLILQRFALNDVPNLTPRYNIAPTQAVPAIRATESGRELAMLRWGLIPSWSKDAKMGNRLLNARSETAAEKPSFRSAFRRRRCLVVADGFYEWQKTGAARGGTTKQPYYIRMRDERPFAFAGLWETWRGPKGAELPTPIQSCTILTTEPNELMQSLHDRMPVILSPDDYAMWLDPSFEQIDALKALQRPFAPEEMIADPVSTLVNSPRNESPECIMTIDQ